MRAMIFKGQGLPLTLEEISVPEPKDDQVQIQVEACGVCRTDVHIVNGELPSPALPLVLGHQIVGTVRKCGPKVSHELLGKRVGVPWLGSTCHTCEFCKAGKENLCDKALFTGYTLQGGFAEVAVASAAYCIPLNEKETGAQLAPLLCAGLISYRAYKLAQAEKTIGLYGFGAAAHIITQVAKAQGKRVYAFTRDGDEKTQAFAKKLGAVWAGGSKTLPPELLDAALIFAPVGELFPLALKAIKKGGRAISAGIHMSDIPSFPYSLLWGERSISSVANLTRDDGKEFFELTVPIQTEVTCYPLEKANDAINDIRNGKLEGAAVLLL